MSTVQTLAIASTSSGATEQLGERLGQKLKGGEVIELISDLGGGKTTFVRGIARGIGSTDNVASPTFTISRVYKTNQLELRHFDFYRLSQAGLIEHELTDVLGDSNIVTVIEWGDVVSHVLPGQRLSIQITNNGENSRQLTFNYPENMSYLVSA